MIGIASPLPLSPVRYAALATGSTARPLSSRGQAERCSVPDLELLDMAGLAVVRGLEMDVYIAVSRRKDAAMPGRVKADNGGFDVYQLEFNLDLLMLLHIMRRVADPVENMEFDQILVAGDQERQRLFGIEAGSLGGLRNKALEVLERTDFGRDRDQGPARHFGPYEKRHPGIKALGHVHGPVRRDARQRGSAIRDRHFAAQLLDWAEAIEVWTARKGLQVERRSELAVHDRLALRADEPELVTQSLDRCGGIGAGVAAGGA